MDYKKLFRIALDEHDVQSRSHCSLFPLKRIVKITLVFQLILLITCSLYTANAATINGISLPYPSNYSSNYGTISDGAVIADNLGSGCWRFAYLVYGDVFHRNMASDRNAASCVVTPYHQVIPTTADNLKTYIRRSGPGAVIRVTSYTSYKASDDNGHSMVIIDSNDNGVWIYQAGANGTILSSNTIKYWTWSEMAQKCINGNFTSHGQYIKYILCPENYRTFGGEPDNPADNLKFNGVVYPRTFKIDTTNGWWLQGGTLESNYQLTSLKSEILNSSGSAVSSYTHNISGYTFYIKSIDNGASENGVKFSKIKSPGSYTWRLSATDSSGRTLVMDMPINAVSSGSTSVSTMSLTYSAPGVTLPSSLSIEMGKRVQINAEGSYSSLSWSSSDTNVAKVYSSGFVFGNRPGTATVTATTDAGDTSTCAVTVTAPSSIDNVTFNHGSQIDGPINSDDRRARIFEVTPASSGYYVFESRYYTTDTIGYVYDANWNLLAQDDDSGENGNFIIRVYLSAGARYYLVGRFYDVSTNGNICLGFEREEQPIEVPSSVTGILGSKYLLDVSLGTATSLNWTTSNSSIVKAPGDGYLYLTGLGSAVVTITDASNSSNTAQCTVYVNAPTNMDSYVNVSAVGTSVSIGTGDSRCARLYGFTAPLTAYYVFYTYGSADTYGVLFDASWNSLAYNDDDGDGNNFKITSLLNEGNVYYLLVRAYSPQNNLSTSLYTHYTALNALTEDDYFSIGIDIPGWNSINSFTPTESGTYAFTSIGSKDTYGYIYDSSFVLLNSNDDGGENTNFCAIYELTAGQTYYMRSRLYSSTDTGSFNLKVCKYVPVAYVYADYSELRPGEADSCLAGAYSEDQVSQVTNPKVWFNPINNDVCTITADGLVTANGNGAAWTTVYADENSSITATKYVLVHDPVNIHISTRAELDGRVYVTINSSGSVLDFVNRFTMYIEDADGLLSSCGGLVSLVSFGDEPFYVQSIQNIPTGTGYVIEASTSPGLNDLPVNCKIELVFETNSDNLWGQTITFSIENLMPIYCLGVDSLVVFPYYKYVTCPSSFTVTFPENTPLTNPDFTLPASTRTIEAEAFSGILAKRVKLPETVTSIGSSAFASCPNLTAIYIPEDCTTIAANAFEGVTNLTIFSTEGSYAEFYATRRGFEFVAVSE